MSAIMDLLAFQYRLELAWARAELDYVAVTPDHWIDVKVIEASDGVIDSIIFIRKLPGWKTRLKPVQLVRNRSMTDDQIAFHFV